MYDWLCRVNEKMCPRDSIALRLSTSNVRDGEGFLVEGSSTGRTLTSRTTLCVYEKALRVRGPQREIWRLNDPQCWKSSGVHKGGLHMWQKICKKKHLFQKNGPSFTRKKNCFVEPNKRKEQAWHPKKRKLPKSSK